MDEYAYHEYPKAMYRDSKSESDGWVPNPPFETLTVNSADEELVALEEGWRLTAEKPKKAA